MLKTGVGSVSNILKNDKTLFRKELKNVSITLYDQAVDEPNASELTERILLMFADGRGAYKRTYAKRFEVFDNFVIEYLTPAFPEDECLKVHDAGVSDGRTAIDFFEKISQCFPNVKYAASDYDPKVYVLENGKCKVTLNSFGKVLEITFPPFVFNMIKRDSYKYYPLNHLLRIILHYFYCVPLLNKYKRGLIKAKEIMLYAPKVLQCMQNNRSFCLEQHNLLTPFKEQVNIIRAMNVLNVSYFSEVEFKTIIKNIYNGLLDGGYFITGSNQESDSLVHGTVYQKTNGRFQSVCKSGDGSPMQAIIENFALENQYLNI